MKHLIRLVALIALLVAVICIILLLNFTAPNPTGRRYSSQVPRTTGQGNSTALGLDGERILAIDLGLPRNDDPDQRLCICNNRPNYIPPLTECRTCVAFSQSVANYRRPDFIGPDFIAESKNRRDLLYTQSDQLEQIGDYAIAARAAGKPLWLYVRVNTKLDPEFYRIVQETGGGVVYYFTVPDYVDPIDQAATAGLFISGGMFVMLILVERSALIFRRRRPRPKSPKPKPRRKDVLDRAIQSVEDADEFRRRSKESGRRKADIESARDDFND